MCLPQRYGISFDERAMDPQLVERRKELIRKAAEVLMRSRMVKFDLKSGNFYSTVSLPDVELCAQLIELRGSDKIVFLFSLC